MHRQGQTYDAALKLPVSLVQLDANDDVSANIATAVAILDEAVQHFDPDRARRLDRELDRPLAALKRCRGA